VVQQLFLGKPGSFDSSSRCFKTEPVWINDAGILQASSLMLEPLELSWHLSDDADAKMILTAPPSENWKRPPGRPHIAWLNTLTLKEAVHLAQNRPLWRLISTYGAMHS